MGYVTARTWKGPGRAFALILWLLCSWAALPLQADHGYPDAALWDTLSPAEQHAISQARLTPPSVALREGDFVSEFIFRALGDAFGLEFTLLRKATFSEVLAAVKQRHATLAANITYTAERARHFHYSPPTNIEYTYLFGSDPELLTDINNRVITVSANSIMADLITSNFPQVSLLTYDTTEQAIEQLLTNQADGAVGVISLMAPMTHAGFSGRLLNAHIPIKPVSLITSAANSSHLLDAFARFYANERFQRALRNLIDQHQQSVKFDRLQQLIAASSLDLSRTFHISIEDLEPYGIYAPDGQQKRLPAGIAHDAVFEACTLIGIHCQLNSHRQQPWSQMMANFRNQQTDIIAPLVPSAERAAFSYFSDPVLFTESVMVKRSGYKDGVYTSISELISERIGVVEGDINHHRMADALPQKSLILYPDNAALLQGLRQQEIDYAPLLHDILDHQFSHLNLFDLTADQNIGRISDSAITLGFQRTPEGAELLALFNQALALIDLRHLKREYIHQVNFQSYYRQAERFNQLLTLMFLLLLIGALVTIISLRRVNRTDHLTRLHNRLALRSRYRKGIGARETLLFIDLNHFKEINDFYGHRIGDQVLRGYARHIRQHGGHEAYRLGGDEFILIGSYSFKALEKLLAELQEYRLRDPELTGELKVQASIGVFDCDVQHKDLDELLSMADIAMYRAKNSQQRSVRVDSDLLDELQQVLQLRRALDQALRKQQLSACFQPLWDTRRKAIIGIECLSRWEYQGRLLSPDVYMEATQYIGAEFELDMISLSCAEQAYLSLAHHQLIDSRFMISVNLSVSSLRRYQQLLSRLAQLAIPQDQLRLEVQESVITDISVMQAINHIIDAGYTMVLDDFGAGLSSIRYLRNSRLRQVKIHQSQLPTDIATSLTGQGSLLPLIRMLQQFGKEVIIEGAESRSQVSFLEQHGVHLMQGYYFAQPMPLGQLISYLAEHLAGEVPDASPPADPELALLSDTRLAGR